MEKFERRGYVVRETGQWFESVLGWYSYVIESGWTEISAVTSKPWGAKACTIQTIDGCKMKFFE